MHFSDPKTWTETKYLFMVLKTLRVLEFELSLAVWFLDNTKIQIFRKKRKNAI